MATAAALLGLAGERNLPRPLQLLDGDRPRRARGRAAGARGQRVRALAVLVTAQVLSVANSNLIAVALPQLSGDLGVSDVQRQWIVDAFVLVFAALLVAGGVLADRYGRRRALVVGLVVFAAGSVACALASSPGLLIAARVVQALGPPLILPASLSIVAVTFADPAARARAIGVWGAALGLRDRRRSAARRRDRQRPRLALGVRLERCGRDRSRRRGTDPDPARSCAGTDAPLRSRRCAARHHGPRLPRLRPHRRSRPWVDVGRRPARVRRHRRARPGRSSVPSVATPPRSSTSNWSAARCSPRPTSRPRR